MPAKPGSELPPTTVNLVEREVRSLLALSPAYQKLPPERQREMAAGMIRIGEYLAEPEGFRTNRLPGAITAIPANYENFLEEVNFPAFVAGLIQGVFQAIVNASIKQMEAYGDLLKKASEALDKFRKCNLSDEHARDWLAEKYPESFDREAPSGKLRLRPDADRSQLISRLRLLPVEGSLRTLDPAEIEKKLVPAARRRIAASRQQLLATMVLMGSNRTAAG